MPAARPFSIVKTRDQWLRATHDRTGFDARLSAVELAWKVGQAARKTEDPPPRAAGLAFDGACRLYRSIPEEGRVERIAWAATDPLRPPAAAPPPVDLFGGYEEAAPIGDFVSQGGQPAFLVEPRGLAVDDDDRLYVVDTKANDVLVFDVWTLRLLRRIHLPPPPSGTTGAMDVCATAGGLSGSLGSAVVVAVEGANALYRIDVHGSPISVGKPWIVAPSRLAASKCGRLAVLLNAGSASARVVFHESADGAFDVPFAADIEFDGAGSLVIARGPGDDLLRYQIEGGTRVELPFLSASGHDGRGIVRTPDGKIAFFTAKGLRYAVPARVRYERLGRVATYRLDGGAPGTEWGRVFLDACIPEGTEVRVACVATDEPPDEPSIAWNPPGNVLDLEITRPDLTPPLPPLSLALPEEERAPSPVHRRETGREIAWARAGADEPFETYEAPIAAVGRYLWITVELSGNTRSTPRVGCIRAERPGHDLLRKLPALFSAEPVAAAFLYRFLAPFEGTLNDLERRAIERRALVSPAAAPAEVLPWLASFLGLALDERWSADVQRKLLEEVVWLFRFRGTVPGLARFIEICVGVRPIIIEHFRLRGVSMLSGVATAPSAPIVGVGFRVGGALGDPGAQTVTKTADDSFATHAHRFSVILPAELTQDELDMVNDLLDTHRPAHTIVDVCTVSAGMRVGLGLHVGLTSIIGRTGGFRSLQVGSAVLGSGVIIGRPGGIPVGPTRLGLDSRIG